MLRFFQRGCWRHFVAALGCVHLLGGPIAVLQTVAWAGMLVTYTAEDGIVQGVTDTFSGEKPCGLCLQVREMEREAPAPTLPNGDEQRRVTDALGQSLRFSEVVELPRPRVEVLAWHRRYFITMNGPEDSDEGPETPPPEGRA